MRFHLFSGRSSSLSQLLHALSLRRRELPSSGSSVFPLITGGVKWGKREEMRGIWIVYSEADHCRLVGLILFLRWNKRGHGHPKFDPAPDPRPRIPCRQEVKGTGGWNRSVRALPSVCYRSSTSCTPEDAMNVKIAGVRCECGARTLLVVGSNVRTIDVLFSKLASEHSCSSVYWVFESIPFVEKVDPTFPHTEGVRHRKFPCRIYPIGGQTPKCHPSPRTHRACSPPFFVIRVNSDVRTRTLLPGYPCVSGPRSHEGLNRSSALKENTIEISIQIFRTSSNPTPYTS